MKEIQTALTSVFRLVLQGACWTTMRTRSLPTWISSGLPSWTGMVLPSTLISSGGTLGVAGAPAALVAADAPLVLAAVVVAAPCPDSAVGWLGFAASPVRVKRVVATMRHVEGVQVRRSPGVSTSTCSCGASASLFQSAS